MEQTLNVQDNLKKKYSNYHILSMQKSHKMAYQKLEKDLERAVNFVVENLSDNNFKAHNDTQISVTQTAMLLNICNAFKEIP